MDAMPWVKYQDYYLRLGFLKALVGVLSPSRRSVLNEAVLKRLRSPLLEPAPNFKKLWSRVEEGALLKKRTSRSTKTSHGGGLQTAASVAEALLVADDCPSFLYGITATQAQKALDWARDVQLIGRGNQITERGLVLRSLLPAEAVDAFLAGDPDAWNPFPLNLRERVFFFYHLGEIDRVTWEIPRSLSQRSIGTVVESATAALLVCHCLFETLQADCGSLSPRATLAYRDAKGLACSIAQELDIQDYRAFCSDVVRRRPERPNLRARALGTNGQTKRVGKKADHETVPRFEQLVDLGFATKWVRGARSETDERTHWKYVPTEVCSRWKTQTENVVDWQRFRSSAFCRAIIDTFGVPKRTEPPSWTEVVERLWGSYHAFHRSIGHTPFESVGLLAMIDAAADGVALEIADFHSLLLAIKSRGALPNHAFFASGTSIDRMFILLKQGFIEEAHRCLATLELRSLAQRN